jgi:hypothetical protein
VLAPKLYEKGKQVKTTRCCELKRLKENLRLGDD